MTDVLGRLARGLAHRYRIERELGSGGMATVYLAEDLKHRRKVAIKVLRPDLAATLGPERFLHEIEVVAGLHHPHILPLYDSGQSEGCLYYVMPFVEGESLRERLRRERELPIEESLRLAAEVADALSYAHSHGVVHRDIKPENILLESGHAIVADFGIAKAVASAGSAAPVTATGLSVGTPAYMSPEQAAGDRNLDGRSDLYSLACVLYEMLAGQPPFTGATIESLVRQHLTVPSPPVTQFRPAVPAAVSDALARALSKNPADRFNPVGQFAAALTLPRATDTIAVSRPKTRNRLLATGAALALALGAWMATRRPAQSATPVESNAIAVLPFENISRDSATDPLVLGMHAEMITQLTKVPGLRVASRNSALQYRETVKTDAQVAEELGVSSLLTGSIQRSGDQVRFTVALGDAREGRQLWAESYDRRFTAQNLFEVQGDIARQVAAALSVRLSPEQTATMERPPTTNLAALDLYYRAIPLWDSRGPASDDTLTVSLLERAVELDPQFVNAWSLLAQARSWLLRTGQEADTLPTVQAVERTARLAPGSLEARLASAYYAYYGRGDFSGALADLEAADRLLPNSGEILLARALLLRRLGRWDEAVAMGRRAIEVDPRNTRVLTDQGTTYLFLRRPDEAGTEFDHALALNPRLASVILEKFALQLDLREDTLAARRFVDASRPLISPSAAGVMDARLAWVARDFRTARRAAEAWPANLYTARYGSRYLFQALTSRSAKDARLERVYADSVLAATERELRIRQRRGPGDPFGTRAVVAVQRAIALALLGNRDQAVALAEAASRSYPPERDHVDGTELLRLLAMTYVVAGRTPEAVATLRRVLSMPSTVAVGSLRLDPMWDPLRSDSGFQALVRR